MPQSGVCPASSVTADTVRVTAGKERSVAPTQAVLLEMACRGAWDCRKGTLPGAHGSHRRTPYPVRFLAAATQPTLLGTHLWWLLPGRPFRRWPAATMRRPQCPLSQDSCYEIPGGSDCQGLGVSVGLAAAWGLPCCCS